MHMNQSVSVYYDETHLNMQKCHGHVLFFVPDQNETVDGSPLFGKISNTYSPRQKLLQEIYNCRGEIHKSHEFHFREISGNQWSQADVLTEKIMSRLFDSLRSKGTSFFRPPLSCKVAVLYHPNSSKTNMYGGETKKEKRQRFSETMLRILLKGSCHFLYNENQRIKISRFIVDGLPAHREFDLNRIIPKPFVEIENNRTPLRDYVEFDKEIKITHNDSDHTKYESGSIYYEDANLLQCADLLLGAFNYAIFFPSWDGNKHFQIGETCNNKKRFLSKPVTDMIHKIDRASGFQNSGHYLSFSVSKVIFEGADVIFQNAEELTARDATQCQNQSKDLLF